MIQLGLQGEPAQGKVSPIPHTDAVSLRIVAEALQSSIGARFEVLGSMAVGGMATLFRVRHRIHGSQLAAKVLHKHLQQRDDVLANFRREAIHIARLADHPNLIPIYDSHFDSDIAFHLYPFVEGEDLDRLIARTPLPRSEALHMAAQISSVLCHMESHGIIHGDISPGNIRVDTFGRYRLLDFGLSRDVKDDVATLHGGTPRYTSPEQIQGQASSHRGDLYALATVLYESIAGKPLMDGSTIEAIERAHRDATWKFTDAVQNDAAVERLLRYLLARDPVNRMASAYELSGALAALGFERPEFRGQQANTASELPIRRSRLVPLVSGETPSSAQ